MKRVRDRAFFGYRSVLRFVLRLSFRKAVRPKGIPHIASDRPATCQLDTFSNCLTPADCPRHFSIMNTGEIRQRAHGKGCIPFTLLTSDGRELPVPHRDFAFVTKRFIIIANDEGFTTTLDPLHIAGVRDGKPLPTA